MHSPESGPRGGGSKPPSFFPGVCSGGYLFSSGVQPPATPLPPANFYPAITQISRSCHYLTLNISETVREYRDEVLTYALLKGVISNDLE